MTLSGSELGQRKIYLFFLSLSEKDPTSSDPLGYRNSQLSQGVCSGRGCSPRNEGPDVRFWVEGVSVKEFHVLELAS